MRAFYRRKKAMRERPVHWWLCALLVLGTVAPTLFAVVLGIAAISSAESILVDEDFFRDTGEPVVISRTFLSLPGGGQAVLRLTNGRWPDVKAQRVTSAEIRLNGSRLSGPSDFNKDVRQLETPVELVTGENTLMVLLNGKPHTSIRVQILQPGSGSTTPTPYVPPADLGFGVRPPTLASKASGLTADGSNNDVGYCHQGYCISSVSTNYYNAKKIKFNVDLIAMRDDPNLHQVLARAFHPYYVTKDENFSTNNCIGGWTVCSPPAIYDMAVRKILCVGLPTDCPVGAPYVWTFQMLHAYLWANQVAGSSDHCGDAEGDIVVIRVDQADPTVAYVWYVRGRDDPYTVHASNLDFTGAHPQFANHRDGCGINGCMGSHHKQYARRTSDGDAHNWTVDNTSVFFHPGLEYDYKRDVDPSLTCVMPYHGYRCGVGLNDERHDSDDARCERSPYNATLTMSTHLSGGVGPWGATKSGNGAFCGGYPDFCPLTSDSACGWGIGLNASWTYGDSDVKAGHPKGTTQ